MESEKLFRNWNVLGIFKDKKEVAHCVSTLRDHHYDASHISILVSNQERRDEVFLHSTKKTKNPEAAITGFGIGGVLGIALGAFFGSGLVPGSEALTSAGPILSSLLGFGLGGSVGAGVGGIIGHLVPEDDAYDYEQGLEADEILLSVHVQNEEEAIEAREIFKQEGADKILLNEKNSKFSESSAFPG